MKAHHLRIVTMPRTLSALAAALILLSVTAGPIAAQPPRGSNAPGDPYVSLVRQYFSDLKLHRYLAAFQLEAPCSASWVVHNPNGPPGSAGLPGRGSHGIPNLQSLHGLRVDRIVRFHTPALDRLHFVGIHVIGWFHWVYPPPSPSFAGNDEFPDGDQTIPITLRRCGGSWWIDPNWVNGPQPIVA